MGERSLLLRDFLTGLPGLQRRLTPGTLAS